jgi:hypothetical protein
MKIYQTLFLSFILIKLGHSNEIGMSDGKPMKMEIDGHDQNELAFDIDGQQFEIEIEHRKPDALDFLPEDLKEEEEGHGEPELDQVLGNFNTFIFINKQIILVRKVEMKIKKKLNLKMKLKLTMNQQVKKN